MKKIINFILISFILVFILSLTVFADYSYEDAMRDYEKEFENSQKEVDDIKNNTDLKRSLSLTKLNSELWQIPDLTFDEFRVLRERQNMRVDEVIRAVQNPCLALIDSIGMLPYASASRGATCDKRVVFFDYYRQLYYVIEYNSRLGDIYVTPSYSDVDGYYFWIWFRLYYVSSGTQNMFKRIGSSFYGNQITSELGTSSTGEQRWVFYVYAFSRPVDYNLSSEVSFADRFGSVYTGQDTSVTTDKKIGQYFYESRWRIMSTYVDYNNPDISVVTTGHSTAPACAGLFLYTDDNMRVMNLQGVHYDSLYFDHLGYVSRNVSIGSYNIYTQYESYIVNGYNYWLFANYCDNYENNLNNVGDYGWLTDFYDTVIIRLDYLSEYVFPQASNQMSVLVGGQVDKINGIINLFIINSSTSSFWFLSILLGVALIFLVLRVVIFVSRW